jgi:hypothetical protein
MSTAQPCPPAALHERLGHNGQAWKKIGASKTLLHWLRHGVPITWRGRPIIPFRKPSPPSTSSQKKWWLSSEAPRLFKQGSLFEYPPGVVPDFCSGAFCVPKGADSWRLVVNAKHVNLACEPRRCRYESLKMLQRIDLSGVHAIKVDVMVASVVR